MGPSVSQRKYKLKFFQRMSTFDVRKDCNAKMKKAAGVPAAFVRCGAG
jgi:hypothetical protein